MTSKTGLIPPQPLSVDCVSVYSVALRLGWYITPTSISWRTSTSNVSSTSLYEPGVTVDPTPKSWRELVPRAWRPYFSALTAMGWPHHQDANSCMVNYVLARELQEAKSGDKRTGSKQHLGRVQHTQLESSAHPNAPTAGKSAKLVLRALKRRGVRREERKHQGVCMCLRALAFLWAGAAVITLITRVIDFACCLFGRRFVVRGSPPQTPSLQAQTSSGSDGRTSHEEGEQKVANIWRVSQFANCQPESLLLTFNATRLPGSADRTLRVGWAKRKTKHHYTQWSSNKHEDRLRFTQYGFSVVWLGWN